MMLFKASKADSKYKNESLTDKIFHALIQDIEWNRLRNRFPT